MAQLSKVEYRGKTYYYDERLKQLRNISNPHDYIDIDDMSLDEMMDLSKVLKKPKQMKAKNRGERILDNAMKWVK